MISVLDPETGKRRQKWFSGYKTKKEAQADVAKKITELNEGTFIAPSKVTLKDYLNHWLEIKSMSIEKSTFAGYKAFINQHVIPSIGMVALHKLNVIHIQKCYKAAIDKGIANNSILLMHRILKSALNLAVKQNIISRNPADFAEIPKRKNPYPDLDRGRSKKVFSSFTRITISHWVSTCNNYRYASGRSSRFTMAGH